MNSQLIKKHLVLSALIKKAMLSMEQFIWKNFTWKNFTWKHKSMKLWLSILFASVGLSLCLQASYITMKASLIHFLIQYAWEKTLVTQKQHRPWPWADTWPVAKLEFQTQQKMLTALAGVSGRTLAFSPGHISASALPSEKGTKIFGAHRDTHFRFLEHTQVGDIINIQSSDNQWLSYQVSTTYIADIRQHELEINRTNKVIFVTCYPFNNWQAGGPLRWVVEAFPIET